jgi:hypothetical protein
MRLLLLLLLYSLSACSSKKDDSMAGTQGMMKKRMLGLDNTNSPDSGKMFNAGGTQGEKGNFFTNKAFKTKDFMGSKAYKTADFAQAGKMSNMGNTMSRLGSQTNRWEKSSYDTKASRWDNKTAALGDKSFRQGDASYQTRDYQPAAKSMSRDTRSVIFGEPNSTPTAYSEEEISNLINR